MLIKQRGILAIATRTIGLFLWIWVGLWILIFLFSLLFFELNLRNWIDGLILILGIALNLAIIFFLGFFGNFFLGLFADIHLDINGIKSKFVIYTVEASWNDIEDIIILKRKNFSGKAIVLNRKGMFINRLYGLFWANLWDKATIILITDETNLELFENYVLERLKNHNAI